jgi:hypothetical protein
MRILHFLLLAALLAIAAAVPKDEPKKDDKPGDPHDGKPTSNVIENVFEYPIGQNAQVVDWPSSTPPAGVHDVWFKFTTTAAQQTIYLCFAVLDSFQYIDVYKINK